eukprot:c34022_g1_i1 orf=318-572(+)
MYLTFHEPFNKGTLIRPNPSFLPACVILPNSTEYSIILVTSDLFWGISGALMILLWLFLLHFVMVTFGPKSKNFGPLQQLTFTS